jgi:hypothetical protein
LKIIESSTEYKTMSSKKLNYVEKNMNADEQRGTDIQIVVDSSGKQANP